MSDQSRGRPVLKRAEPGTSFDECAAQGELWIFCGEHQGRGPEAVDEAVEDGWGTGIYKVFPTGSWPGGYLRD